LILFAGPVVAVEEPDEQSSHIVVGTELAYPPYSFLDENGEAAGYNVELTRAIAEVMGMDVEIRIGPWGDIRKGLESGEIDAISGMFYSEKRDRLVDFTPAYTTVHHAVFARNDSPGIKSEQELRGSDIIVMRGDIMHDYVLEKGLCESPVLADTQADALRLLAAGNHDYAVVGKLPGLYWVKELKLSNIVVVGPLLRRSDYCYAVVEGNASLQGRFGEGLAILKRTGRYRDIHDKWLGVLEPRGAPIGTILKYVALALVPVLLLVMGVLFWSWSLKRQVAQRTRDLKVKIAERMQAQEQMVRQTALLEAINRVFRESLTCETEEEVAKACLAVAEELTGSAFGFIGELNEAGLKDDIAISDTGWEACRIPETQALKLVLDMPIRGIWSRVFKDDRSHLTNDPDSHPDRLGTPEGHPPLTAFLGVPLRQGDKTFGIIALANKESAYDESDQRAIESLAAAFVEALMRKRAEVRVRKSLKEKEVLLGEIHHRVKNNLQVISSLLNLQSNLVDDNGVGEMFRESRNRVRSMALTHEQLYRSEDLARVDFGRYIRDLARGLYRSYGVDPDAVRLTVDVGDVSLALDTAIPCGLMVNELVSNCFKHAFSEGNGGEILIRLRSDEERYTLVVRDNGIGFPEDLDFRNTETLGLQLVNSLADQLGGTIELDRSDGTEFRITLAG